MIEKREKERKVSERQKEMRDGREKQE